MKKLMTVLIFTIQIMVVNAQGLNNPQKGPEFKGGKKALTVYLNKHIQYPELARRQGLEGTVKVTIDIDAEGKIGDDMRVVKSMGSVLDKEAVRLIKNMPDWTPAKQGNYPVAVKYQLSIRFKLD